MWVVQIVALLCKSSDAAVQLVLVGDHFTDHQHGRYCAVLNFLSLALDTGSRSDEAIKAGRSHTWDWRMDS